MSRRQDGTKLIAPPSISHGKSSAEVELINHLAADLLVSDAELDALEVLVG